MGLPILLAHPLNLKPLAKLPVGNGWIIGVGLLGNSSSALGVVMLGDGRSEL